MAYLEESFCLTQSHRTTLLTLARTALAAYFQRQPPPNNIPDDPELHVQVGLFVTLWQHQETAVYQPGHLRGCIGHVETKLPLFYAVQQTAVEAATRDPRFPPLSPHELDHIRLEISVLSPLVQVEAMAQIELGTHGLMLVSNNRRGLLLPQVPITRGWNREQFIHALHKKAQMPLGVWPDTAQLYAFTTIMFEETGNG